MNTGKKTFLSLVEYYLDSDGNKVYTGNSKDNTPEDPDYIAPVESASCPIETQDKIWIGHEQSAYCEDGDVRPRRWIGFEQTAYCEQINEPSTIVIEPLSLYVESLAATQYGTPTGQAAVVVSGGKAPFTYSLDGTTFQSSALFTGLFAGSYTVVVRDFLGSSTIKQFIITQPPREHNATYVVALGVTFFNESGVNTIYNDGSNNVKINMQLQYLHDDCIDFEEATLEAKLLLMVTDVESLPKTNQIMVAGDITFEMKTNGSLWVSSGTAQCVVGGKALIEINNISYNLS